MFWKTLNFLVRRQDYFNVIEVAACDFSRQTRELREAHQVEQFNRVWADAYGNTPFYAKWKQEHGLPDGIQSLDETESWPIVTKRDLQKGADLLVRTDRPADGHSMTGGSTGEPMRFGTWKEDGGLGVAHSWIGRRMYGVEPGDRTALLWGHQHLYGKGLNRQINVLKRKTKDRLLNFRRIQCFDLSPSAMQSACSQIVRFSPTFLIAVSCTATAFCRANRAQADACRRLGLKCVMCTGGALSEDERAEISTFFNAPVCMQYGSVECADMAHTVPSGGYNVYWQTHILQPVADDYGAQRNIVTCLTRRYLPLIRYDVGDYLNLYPDETRRPHRFISVEGRPNEIIKFSDGSAFYGGLLGECVKQVPKVLAHQTIIHGDEVLICVLADGKLTPEEADLIVLRSRTVVPALKTKKVSAEQRDRLKVSIGGKVPLVIYE